MLALAIDYASVADKAGALASIEGIEEIPLPVDHQWRTAVKRRLKEMGLDQYDLAAHIGCSQSNISQTLSVRLYGVKL